MRKSVSTLVIFALLASFFTSCASRNSSSEVKATTTTSVTSTEAVTTQTLTTKAASTMTTTAKTTSTKSTTTKTTTSKSTSTNATKTKKTTTTPAVTKKEDNSSTKTTTPTTTVVTKVKPTKKRVQLDVVNIQQCPELPMGCEAVSGSIALQWYGFKVDKFSLLPYQPMMEEPTKDGVWGDPNEVFVGNPYTHKWGCYSPVIKRAIEGYFEANGVKDYEVISLNGSNFVDLYQEIDNNNPIILWVTTWMQNLEKGEQWKLKDGSIFTWTKHEHCVCLIGYDTINDTVIISDPYDPKGTVEYPRATVENVYKQLNNMALVIHKK